jgi:DNA (cytosine-5)-methyltransferase 1
MRYISVCSGIEAASVAWHALGWTPLAFSEVDAFPSAVLAARWPDVPNLGDMTKFADWPDDVLADCDLLVGGTPCQAFSVAGLRKSLDDSRGNLTLVYVQLWNRINEIRRSRGRSPAIALWENVPGVLSTKDNAFGCFVGGLLGCDDAPETQDGKWPKAGFLCSETVRVGWRILDAQYFGVAQRRRRVFVAAVPSELIGRLGDQSCPSEILSIRESLLGNPPTRGAKGKGFAGDAAEGSGENGGGVSSRAYPCIDAQIDAKWGSNQWVDAGCPVFSKTLCGKQSRLDTETETLICFHPTQDTISNDQGVSHAIRTGSPSGQSTSAVAIIPFDTTQMTSKLNRSHPKAGDPMHPLAAGADAPDVVAFKESQSGCRTGDVHATIDSNKGTRRQEGVLSDMDVRRLTPRECERLQGFPDDYTAVAYRKKPAADGPRYKALGNSMAVPCMWWLGYRIGQAFHTLPDKVKQ